MNRLWSGGGGLELEGDQMDTVQIGYNIILLYELQIFTEFDELELVSWLRRRDG